jgi:hypothetical protein
MPVVHAVLGEKKPYEEVQASIPASRNQACP